MTDLTHPGAVVGRLQDIDEELAVLQNDYEDAAMDWFRQKRAREQSWAEVFMSSSGSVEARKAQATVETAELGLEAEARFEALKAKARVLETRASIGQSILKAQGRA